MEVMEGCVEVKKKRIEFKTEKAKEKKLRQIRELNTNLHFSSDLLASQTKRNVEGYIAWLLRGY